MSDILFVQGIVYCTLKRIHSYNDIRDHIRYVHYLNWCLNYYLTNGLIYYLTNGGIYLTNGRIYYYSYLFYVRVYSYDDAIRETFI